MMRNFVQKKSFRAKPRNCGARELTVSWKPTNRNKKPLDKQKIYLQNFAQRKFVMNQNATLKIKFHLNLNIILWQSFIKLILQILTYMIHVYASIFQGLFNFVSFIHIYISIIIQKMEYFC